MTIISEFFVPCEIRSHNFFIHTDHGNEAKRKVLLSDASFIKSTSFKKYHKGLSSVKYIKRKSNNK